MHGARYGILSGAEAKKRRRRSLRQCALPVVKRGVIGLLLLENVAREHVVLLLPHPLLLGAVVVFHQVAAAVGLGSGCGLMGVVVWVVMEMVKRGIGCYIAVAILI